MAEQNLQATQHKRPQNPVLERSRARSPGRLSVAKLRLLGGFELTLANGVAAPSPIGQRILAMLALRDRPATRSFVAGSLWPDCAEKKAAGSLRSALWRLKSVHRELVFAGTSTIALNDEVHVDTDDLLSQSRRILDVEAGETSNLDIDLFSNDLLPDWYDDWVYFERERLRHLRLAALERHALQMLDASDFLAAIHAADAAIAGEPLRESAHRILVRAHLKQGNYSEAITQYNTYARLLDDALGLKPSPLMTELVGPLMVK